MTDRNNNANRYRGSSGNGNNNHDNGYDDNHHYGGAEHHQRSRERDGRRQQSISPPPHHNSNRRGNRMRSNDQNNQVMDRGGFHHGPGENSRGRGRGRGNSSRGGRNNNGPPQVPTYNERNNVLGGQYSYSPPLYNDEYNNNNNNDQPRVYDRRQMNQNKQPQSYSQENDSVGFNPNKEVDSFSVKARGGDRVPDKLDPEMREVFPFRIFIKDEYLKEGIASKSETDEIIRTCCIDTITMDNQIQVPDIPGQAMIIEADDLQKRQDALRMILQKIERVEMYLKSKEKKQQVDIELMTFVPEGLVAVTIGHKGRLIQRIKEETGVAVIINQRVRGMTYRSTYAIGSPDKLAKACAIMYNTMEEQAYLIKDWDKIKTESISKEDVKLTAKFIVDTDACGFIIGRHGNFTKYLEHQLGIYMRCDKDGDNRILKQYQSICAMKGTLKDIQKGIKELCKRLEDYYKSLSKDFSRFPFNVVIPANYVTKIIGAGGCMVKTIAQHANGAQIKINSEKDSKKSIREVSVAINGTLEGKYKAAHLIIEQVEIFKNGGPIIQSGKVLNQNLAAQIQNSGLFKDQPNRRGDHRGDDRDYASRRNRNESPNDNRGERDGSKGRKRKTYSRSRSKSPSNKKNIQDKYKRRSRSMSNNDQEEQNVRSQKQGQNRDQYQRNRSRSRSRSPSNRRSPVERDQQEDRSNNNKQWGSAGESKNLRVRNNSSQADDQEILSNNWNNNSQSKRPQNQQLQQQNSRSRDQEQQQILGYKSDNKNSHLMKQLVMDQQQFDEEENNSPNKVQQQMSDQYTNPDEIESEQLPQKEQKEDENAFTMISQYSTLQNQHIFKLGIQLSKNHPVLKNEKVFGEMRDKIKGIQIEEESIRPETGSFQIDGSISQIVQLIKQLSTQIIKTETAHLQQETSIQQNQD